MLASNLQSSHTRVQAAQPSLLAGNMVDQDGQPLIAVHATKGKVRYHYYVSGALHHGHATHGLRLPDREIERVVAIRIATLLADALPLIGTAWLSVPPGDTAAFAGRCAALHAAAARGDRTILAALIRSVRIAPDGLKIACGTAALATALEVVREAHAPATITLNQEVITPPISAAGCTCSAVIRARSSPPPAAPRPPPTI